MNILGVWDNHVSGATFVTNNAIRNVIKEEKLFRRKLEVEFTRYFHQPGAFLIWLVISILVWNEKLMCGARWCNLTVY